MAVKGLATLIAIFALCFNSLNRVSGDTNQQPKAIIKDSEEIAFQKLLKMEKGMKESIKKLVDQALPMLMNSNSSVELSGPCMGSILKIIGALKKLRLWPLQMLDAIGKPSGGMFSGMVSALGSYQQCIDIVIPTFNKKNKPNVGQYCVIELSPPLPPKPPRIKYHGNFFPHVNATLDTELMTEMLDTLAVFYSGKFKWGICLPNTCTIDDIKQVLPSIKSQIGWKASVKSCEIKETFKMDTLQVVIASIISSFVLINIVATIIHELQLYINKVKKTKPVKGFGFKAARYFSVRQNFTTLMRTKDATPRSLDALNGIRVISMIWVVLCHGYFSKHPSLLRETMAIVHVLKEYSFQIVLNGFLSVSSFFFLAAVLVAYQTTKRHDAGKYSNPLIMLLRRIYRITPTMLLSMGIVIMRPLFASGPIYKDLIVEMSDRCRENWWKNVLFINNFYEMNSQCEVYMWYLGVDIQCFIFGIIYFVILFKNKAAATTLLVGTTLVSTAYVAYVTYINDFPPSMMFIFVDVELTLDFTRKTYMAFYTYLGLYSVGLYLGTYLARNPKIKINKVIGVICWIVALSMGLTILFSVRPWNAGEPYSMLEAIFYSSLNRLGWGIALGLIVLVCFSGRGGVINDFLSWPGFQPLVRLSYIVYLTHCHVYHTYNFSLKGPQDASHTTVVFDFLGCLVISHMIAVVVRVTFEYPVLKVEDDLFKWFENERRNKKNSQAMSVNLNNSLALKTVELKKVTVNGVQLPKEMDEIDITRDSNIKTAKELEVE